MIKLNPVYLFDKDGLSEYLHQQALDENHITYVTSDFLVFKKGEPKDIYFTVLLSDDRPIEKVKREAVSSSYEYKIYPYNKDEEFSIELCKQSRLSKYICITPLANIIFSLLLISTINRSMNNFILGNSGRLFSVITFPICVGVFIFYCFWLWRKKKAVAAAKKNHEYLFKSKWDYIGKLLAIIVIFISCFIALGFSNISLLIIVLYLLFHFILSDVTLPIFITIMLLYIFIFIPTDSRNDQSFLLKEYLPSTSSVSMYNCDRTLFVSKYENLVAWDYTTSHNVTIMYDYYHVTSSWTLNKLEEYLFIHQRNPIQLDTYESLSDDAFERAYIKTVEGEVQLYYFQSGDHILILTNHSPNTTEQVIRFAKMKLNIGG
ncbi:MAG: hypothetical protein ACLRVU_13080 [Beduini sp.]|uniref:hypothetical protein n=1 Tax=Beduini sp. TaxID=1922300 RepID=UPI0039A33F85